MYVCMYVRMYVCMYIYIFIYVSSMIMSIQPRNRCGCSSDNIIWIWTIAHDEPRRWKTRLLFSLAPPTRPVGLQGTPEQNGFEREGSQTGLHIRPKRVFEIWWLYCYVCSRQQNHLTKQPDNQPRLLGDQASRSKGMQRCCRVLQAWHGNMWRHRKKRKKRTMNET